MRRARTRLPPGLRRRSRISFSQPRSSAKAASIASSTPRSVEPDVDAEVARARAEVAPGHRRAGRGAHRLVLPRGAPPVRRNRGQRARRADRPGEETSAGEVRARVGRRGRPRQPVVGIDLGVVDRDEPPARLDARGVAGGPGCTCAKAASPSATRTDVRQVPERRPHPRVRVLELGEPALECGERIVAPREPRRRAGRRSLPVEPAQLERRIRVRHLVDDARDRLLEVRALRRLRVPPCRRAVRHTLSASKSPPTSAPRDVITLSAGSHVVAAAVVLGSTTNSQRGPAPGSPSRTRRAPELRLELRPLELEQRELSAQRRVALRQDDAHPRAPRTEARPPRDYLRRSHSLTAAPAIPSVGVRRLPRRVMSLAGSNMRVAGEEHRRRGRHRRRDACYRRLPVHGAGLSRTFRRARCSGVCLRAAPPFPHSVMWRRSRPPTCGPSAAARLPTRNRSSSTGTGSSSGNSTRSLRGGGTRRSRPSQPWHVTMSGPSATTTVSQSCCTGTGRVAAPAAPAAACRSLARRRGRVRA